MDHLSARETSPFSPCLLSYVGYNPDTMDKENKGMIQVEITEEDAVELRWIIRSRGGSGLRSKLKTALFGLKPEWAEEFEEE